MRLITLIFYISFGTFIQLSNCEEETNIRQPSLFKAGDEWLALPEVFSNLDFDADSIPAAEDDIAGQLKLRSTRFWGRLYIDGWPQTIQYFRAHFGIEPPTGLKRFVFAEPRHGCEELQNAGLLTSDHVLLVNRGICTYGTKARFAHKTKASAIIIINNEPGVDHLPGPDAHDIQYSISSIQQTEGQLLEAFYDEGPSENGFGRKLEGYIVPINCENNGANCVPATYKERHDIKVLSDGGVLTMSTDNTKIEYLLAHFGVKAPHPNMTYSVVVAKPVDSCTTLENDVKGKVVLVRRGGCSFVTKAEQIQQAGGRVMVLGTKSSVLLRMGVEPRWKGLNTMISVVMISQLSYSALIGETYTRSSEEFYVQFNERYDVNGTLWGELEKLVNGEGWPRSDAYVMKKYNDLLHAYADWPDRVASIKLALTKNYKHLTINGEGSIKSEL